MRSCERLTWAAIAEPLSPPVFQRCPSSRSMAIQLCSCMTGTLPGALPQFSWSCGLVRVPVSTGLHTCCLPVTADGRPLYKSLNPSSMSQLLLLARALSGCLVTSSACLPPAVIKALLSGGCKAVVCRESEAGDAEEPSQAAALFSALYERLHAGRQLMQASHLPVGVTRDSRQSSCAVFKC